MLLSLMCQASSEDCQLLLVNGATGDVRDLPDSLRKIGKSGELLAAVDRAIDALDTEAMPYDRECVEPSLAESHSVAHLHLTVTLTVPTTRSTERQLDQVLAEALHARAAINTVIVLTHEGSEESTSPLVLAMRRFVTAYRLLVSEDLLHAHIALSGRVAPPTAVSSAGVRHTNDVELAGYSDQVLKLSRVLARPMQCALRQLVMMFTTLIIGHAQLLNYIADRGSGDQLRYIERIDSVKHIAAPDKRKDRTCSLRRRRCPECAPCAYRIASKGGWGYNCSHSAAPRTPAPGRPGAAVSQERSGA